MTNELYTCSLAAHPNLISNSPLSPLPTVFHIKKNAEIVMATFVATPHTKMAKQLMITMDLNVGLSKRVVRYSSSKTAISSARPRAMNVRLGNTRILPHFGTFWLLYQSRHLYLVSQSVSCVVYQNVHSAFI